MGPVRTRVSARGGGGGEWVGGEEDGNSEFSFHLAMMDKDESNGCGNRFSNLTSCACMQELKVPVPVVSWYTCR